MTNIFSSLFEKITKNKNSKKELELNKEIIESLKEIYSTENGQFLDLIFKLSKKIRLTADEIFNNNLELKKKYIQITGILNDINNTHSLKNNPEHAKKYLKEELEKKGIKFNLNEKLTNTEVMQNKRLITEEEEILNKIYASFNNINQSLQRVSKLKNEAKIKNFQLELNGIKTHIDSLNEIHLIDYKSLNKQISQTYSEKIENAIVKSKTIINLYLNPNYKNKEESIDLLEKLIISTISILFKENKIMKKSS